MDNVKFQPKKWGMLEDRWDKENEKARIVINKILKEKIEYEFLKNFNQRNR